MRRFLASSFSRLAACCFAALSLTGCLDDAALGAISDDISCNLSTAFSSGRSMDEGHGVVYGAPLSPAPELFARGAVEDLVFSVPTANDTEDTVLEPKLTVEGDALATQTQSLSCATADKALIGSRIEARAVGTAKIVVASLDGVQDSVSFEVREAATIEVNGPTEAEAGDELYVAAEVRDAQDIPLYASSSVTWSVLEGDVTLPEADENGELHGAYAMVRFESATRAVIQAEALGLTSTLVIEAADAP